jgi:hypothetical protein
VDLSLYLQLSVADSLEKKSPVAIAKARNKITVRPVAYDRYGYVRKLDVPHKYLAKMHVN